MMMVQEKSGYADVGDGKLYYEVAGEGETLVLIHAGFVDSGMWDAQWDEFAQHYQVIRFDMRGYGKSDPARAPVSRRRDLFRLLEQFGVDRAHLLGCSMGGEMIIDFTLEHPEMVSSLITVSATPSGFELQGEPPRYLFEMMDAAQKGDVDRASELQIRIWVDGMYREPDQVDPHVRQHAAAMNRIPVRNGTFAIADMQPLDPLAPPAVKRLNEIRVPTLVIAGALDHPEILRAADVIKEQIPNAAKKVVIPDTAHVPNIEKPAEFNRLVLEFLGGVK
jgi:pimeloyl-ACP methyl ester carboxylesterase